MVQACNGPTWVIDDFTQCFQQRYLQLIFPLAASGLSILLIAIHVARYILPTRLKQVYEALPTDPVNHEDVVEDGEEQDEDAESDLMLHKAVSRTTQHSIELDRPKARHTLIILEILGLLVVVGVRIAALATHSETEYGTTPLVVRLWSWVYILALVSARVLFSTTDRHHLPKFWNHTAVLYGLQWLFSVSLFRSQVIHPSSQNVFVFTAIEFSVSSFLLLLTVTARKGNKEILVHYEDGLTPPRDQFASLLSLASFSWLDSLVWQGYKKTLEISDVWNLTPSYQAAAVLMDFRQTRRTSILAWRLLRYFDRTLLLQGAWTMFSGLFTFIPTWLLKLILEYVEDPESTPKNAAWLYVILLFCCGAIQGVADGQALWMGRRLSVKLRAIIIGELYAKALRRKAGANVESTKEQEDKPAKVKRTIFGSKKKSKKDSVSQTASKSGPDSVENQANIGKIINLMAIDSFKVSEICAYLHYLWASFPVQIIIAIFMLYRILGFSSFAGIALMIMILPLNMIFASQFRKVQNDILASTDARIHSTNEVLQNIRIIKYFAWEQRFEDIINEKRRNELNCLRRRYVIWSLAATLWYGTPIVITFTTFFLYTVVEGKRLVPSIAFPALSMFTLLRVPLDQLADMVAHVQESKVSVDRVESFLNEEETEKYSQLRHSDHSLGPLKIGLENATLSWGSSPANQEGSQSQDVTEAFRLINMNISFKIGKLNVIAGPTGSGKTSLLMALLGEMKLIEGTVSLPGGLSNRSDLRPNPLTGLIESIAYCAQEAWLVNGTIKENILFASPFDETRYRAVIKACSLERDLDILDAGDQALVGEKGISLSGGQKQRISLARALYSNARHLLLDDCLSAVDSHTARHIVHYAILGPLMQHRTCILVTHNVSLAVPESDYVVVLDNGKISAQGSPEEVAKSGALGEELQQSGPPSRSTSRPPSRIPSNLEEERDGLSSPETDEANGTANGNADGPTTKQKKKADPVAEEKMTGSVKLSTIKMYLAAMGSWYYWIFAFVVFAAQQIGSLSTNLWIRQWANAYHVGTSASSHTGNHMSVADIKLPSLVTANVPRPFSWKMPHVHLLGSNPEGEGDVKVSYYLSVYALLGLAYILISLSREIFLFWGSLHASWKLHRRLLTAVTHAKFKFFDSTPLGRLMNRFSKDIEAIDQDVAPSAIGMLHCLAAVIMIVILISVITPGFLIAGVFITLIYSALGAIYLQSSRDLKRMESVQRSPLYQQFGETLNGIVTIRAYGDGARFILDNHRLINTYNRPYIYLWATNRWLAFRVDLTGALVAFFSGVFVILSAGRIDAGAAGLALTYAVTFTENILWLVRLYAENQQNMNSVERVEEYLGVEQEAAAVVPHNRPPRSWPTKGGLKFENYSTRYRPDLDPVLKNVSFNVQPGERVGIVGRTGAGKSSLALALFRGLEAETGRILIDDVDIGLIGLKDLREAITIVPQDPTLFTGTIRSNLDPFGLLSDEEIFTGLRRVHLIGPATSQTASGATTPNVSSDTAVDTNDLNTSNAGDTSHLRENKNIFLNLQSPISESGSNLSQGQRQLLCLARAMLRNPKVLMMDEATASIDYATDAKIQDTLRELKDNTIITIAHRLQTIIDYDKVLVLDHGKVVEYDGPWPLINKQDGLFKSMCESSGNMEVLLDGAKKAWEQKRLVDDS